MHKSEGFTLIELLVVIGIIALLSSILFPALGTARDTAKSIGCQSTLKQLGVAMQMYTNDWNGWYPQRYQNANNYAWPLTLADYLNYRFSGAAAQWGPPVFHCPAGKPLSNLPGYSRGYSANFYVLCNQFGNGRVGGAKNEGSQMLLLDIWVASWNYGEADVSCALVSNRDYKDLSGAGVGVALRHRLRFNYSNKDGSVHSNNPGKTGYGADVKWFITTAGQGYVDGQYY